MDLRRCSRRVFPFPQNIYTCLATTPASTSARAGANEAIHFVEFYLFCLLIVSWIRCYYLVSCNKSTTNWKLCVLHPETWNIYYPLPLMGIRKRPRCIEIRLKNDGEWIKQISILWKIVIFFWQNSRGNFTIWVWGSRIKTTNYEDICFYSLDM